MPSRKADPLTLGDTVHRYFLSVTMILYDKMDFSFGVTAFCRAVTNLLEITL